MPGNTKNIGQVSGVFLGTTPPSNTSLIWYDTTPSQRCHKVYDASLNTWVIIDQNIVSSITYSELVNLANGVGLSIAKFYQISDRGNLLALSITGTKVQYCDELGNILIDDLGTNIQYHVTSSNLQIDDIAGVFDVVNKKLVFQFDETIPDFTANDYILGKKKRNNIWSLAKYRLSSFISSVTGNSISWNGGFFFNFNRALQDKMDVPGGVVSKDTYDTEMDVVNQSINNVASENQSIIENANQAIENATTDDEIYGKQVPPFETGGEPTDVAFGDTLLTIVSKFYRWVSKFKIADGIKLTNDFTESQNFSYINNQDNVDSAFRKVQYWFKNLTSIIQLPSGWTPSNRTDDIDQVSEGDTLNEAFSKLAGKFDQIGDIETGKISSKRQTNNDEPRTILNLDDGYLEINRDDDSSSQNYVLMDKYSGVFVSCENTGNFKIDATRGVRGNNIKTNEYFSIPVYESEWDTNVYHGGGAALFMHAFGKTPDVTIYDDAKIVAAISAECQPESGYNGEFFDAYFKNFKAGSLSLGHKRVHNYDTYLGNDCSFVSCVNTASVNVYLPPTPQDGRMIVISQMNSSDVNVYGNGHDIIGSQNYNNISVGGSGKALILMYNPYRIGSINVVIGCWLCYRL